MSSTSFGTTSKKNKNKSNPTITDYDRSRLKAHREQLQKEIDRIAGLLKGKDVHISPIDSLASIASGAPSNTPVHSPKRYSYSSSKNYITGRPLRSQVKPFQLQASLQEDESHNLQLDDNHRPSSNSKFLSINDLLSSENNFSTLHHDSSPLGDKTLDFINQTSVTANNTLFHNYSGNVQVDSTKKTDVGETSNTIVPIDVLEDRKSHVTKGVDISITSSQNRSRFDPNYSSPFVSRTSMKRETFFTNNYSNVLDYEVSKNLLALSSSPMPKFETRFPDPRPIHELFESVPNMDDHLREDDEKTNSVLPSDEEEEFNIKEVDIENLDDDHEDFGFKSDKIDEELKKPDKNPVYSSSPQGPKFEVSSNIRLALRKRKPVNYCIESTEGDKLGDSPKTSRLKRRTLRSLKQTKQQVSFASSSPAKRTSSSGSNKSSCYHRRKKSILPRSKSGCWTCRIRKKKCTEEKPSCIQCENLGLKCDGYSDEKPLFMHNAQLQRKRLDEIKDHTSKRKKIGIKKAKFTLGNDNNDDGYENYD